MQNINSPDDCVFFQLSNAARHSARYWKQAVASLGITGTQALLLNFMHQNDAMLASQLAHLAKLDAATLTGLADRLEKKGLLTRNSHPDDRRTVYLSLTSKGKGVSKKVRSLMSTSNQTYLKQLSDHQIKQLKTLLQQLQGEA